MWDGLVRLAQHALNTEAVPSSHGTRPRVTVTIDADTLSGDRAGVGVTEDGLDLAGSAVRRMACDCDLIRVLLDADGCVLDVGRDHRLVTPAIWTALVARDHHCAFPGCTRPPVMCHAHHIRHWADGGATPSTTSSCCAATTTAPSTTPPGKYGSPPTGDPSSGHHPNPGRPPPDWIRHRPRHE